MISAKPGPTSAASSLLARLYLVAVVAIWLKTRSGERSSAAIGEPLSRRAESRPTARANSG
jgi:hypothetical protein